MTAQCERSVRISRNPRDTRAQERSEKSSGAAGFANARPT